MFRECYPARSNESESHPQASLLRSGAHRLEDEGSSARRGLPPACCRRHGRTDRQSNACTSHRIGDVGGLAKQGGIRPGKARRTTPSGLIDQRIALSFRPVRDESPRHARFDGEHQNPSWPAARKTKAPNGDCAPSEQLLKPWPTEAHLGESCPSLTGTEHPSRRSFLADIEHRDVAGSRTRPSDCSRHARGVMGSADRRDRTVDLPPAALTQSAAKGTSVLDSSPLRRGAMRDPRRVA